MKRFLSVLLLLGASLLLMACGRDDEDVAALPSPIVIPTTITDGTATAEPTAVATAVTVTEQPTTAAATAVPTTAAVATSPVTTCNIPTGWFAYTIVAGDTLFRIAQRTGSSVDQLAQANCLANVNTLVTGSVLYVPQAPTAPNPVDDFQRIEFAAGTDRILLSSTLPAGGSHDFVFSAQAGQLLNFNVGLLNDARVTVRPFNKSLIVDTSTGRGVFVLPESGDYFLAISSATGGAYELFFNIPANYSGAALERVQFASGATSGRVVGSTPNNQFKQFVVGAQAGQILQIDQNVPSNIVIAVRGADGTPIENFGSDVSTSYGPYTLPSTQDYIIALLPIGSESYNISAPYDLTISITNDGVVTVPEPVVQVIQFPAGATSAAVAGQLLAGRDGDRYSVQAAAGQWMLVDVAAAGNQAYLGLSIGSQILSPGSIGGVFPASYLVQLPQNGNYMIDVLPINNAVDIDYTLTVSIVSVTPQVFSFETGSVEGEVAGTLAPYGIFVYSVGAAAGQEMTLTLNSASSDMVYTVLGVGTPPPVYTQQLATPRAFSLPTTGNYLIGVANSGSSAADFVMKIRIE